MAYQGNPRNEVSWEKEKRKEGKSLCSDVNNTLSGYGVNIKIGEDGAFKEERVIFGTWNNVWSKAKKELKEARRKTRKEGYLEKKMQRTGFKLPLVDEM